MTAPTHIAFAAVCGLLCGTSEKMALGLIAAGALLPDLDHPQSAIGRVLFFISHPLNRLFGHRTLLHSIILWMPIFAIGLFHGPIMFLAAGALTHCFLDCLNVSGVQLCYPVTQRAHVLFNRSFRFPSGSKNEFVLLICLILLINVVGYVGAQGGFRYIIRILCKSYDMAYDQYLREGDHVCYLKGKLREPAGRIREGRWLVIGKEEGNKLAIWDQETEKILHLPDNALFLSAVLEPQKESWQSMKAETFVSLNQEAFALMGKKWTRIKAGDTAIGTLISKDPFQIRPQN